jgi:hypothetical protein
MEEKFLYHIWDEGHLSPELQTISGKRLKVVYPGQYNTARGPDFFNCILDLGGETIRGAVEIHLLTNDWQAHNHQEDIYYNDVILHVVLKHNNPYAYTVREDGKPVEILEIQNQLSEDITKLIRMHNQESRRLTYCDLLSAIDTDYLSAILTQAGLRRFWTKVKRFNAALAMSSFDQVLYEGLMEAIGYSSNKMNTLMIAHSLNLESLKQYKAEGMSSAELISILLCSTGLLDKAKSRVTPALSEQLLQFYEQQKWYARHLDIAWQLFRIRPASHPLNRLIVMAEFLWQHLDSGLLSYLAASTNTADPSKRFRQFASCLSFTPSFGEGHFNALGKNLLATMYLNVYLPVMALWAQKTSDDTTLVAIINAYKTFNGLQDNYVLRFMNRYLSTEHVKLIKTKSIYQQGIMDVYHRFCNWHYCEECLRAVKQ